MALQISGNFKFKGIQWKSGHLYKFRYSAWNEDPDPLIILLYKFSGTHPKTKRQWRFIQALNMNYVPRSIRKKFAKTWVTTLENNNGNVLLTWNVVKKKYPGIAKSSAIRRYFYSPTYYIQKPVYIPVENMEEAVIGSWTKDFGGKVKRALARKYKAATSKRKKRVNEGEMITNALKYLWGGRK